MGGIGSADSGVRVSAGAGLMAFALSTIVAIFSSVSLGMMFLRASASGVVFSILTYGAFLLIQRFIPELLQGDEPVERTGAAATGTMVNIVLPGGEDTPEDLRDDDMEIEDAVAIAGRRYSGVPIEVEAAMASGLSDRTPRTTWHPSRTTCRIFDRRTCCRRIGRRIRPMEKAARPSVALDELDVLPDLDSLSDSFVSESHETGFNDVTSAGAAPAGGGSSRIRQGRSGSHGQGRADIIAQRPERVIIDE